MKCIKYGMLCLVLWFAAGWFHRAWSAEVVKSPEMFFGFQPGADRKLVTYKQLIAYLQHLESHSGRLRLLEFGKTTLGKPMFLAFISSRDNLQRLDSLKEINRKLATDSGLDSASRAELYENGRVFVMASLSMHSSEVGPSQMLPEFAHRLVTSKDRGIVEHLSNVVLMMVASLNPDGMDMIDKHYRTYLNTKYEGCTMPGLYHKYVGHDNNRDFLTLSQKESLAFNRVFLSWYPHVYIDKHQMGTTGPRYYVPPFHDPVSENYDHAILEWIGVFGAGLSRDLGARGLSGVANHWVFDNYWLGSTATANWKNVISMLTEAASCKLASPVYIEPTEIAFFGKGLSENKVSVNLPDPWKGGLWRLSDILVYENASMDSMLKTASLHRREILRFRAELCLREIHRGRTEPPYYYVIPAKQHDGSEMVRMVNLLKEHGVRVYRLRTAVEIGSRVFVPQDVIVPLSQPYRAFIKEAMEGQMYPQRHYTPGGELIRPYDVTSWSLPLHAGVECIPVTTRSKQLESSMQELENDYRHPDKQADLDESFWALAYPVEENASFKAAFYALDLGLRVDRLSEPLSLKNRVLSAGSFLIYPKTSKTTGLKSIFQQVETQPIVLKQKHSVSVASIKKPSIAVVETYMHDMDAGWTRFFLDAHRVGYTVLRPGDFEKLDLKKKFDVIVFPDTSKDLLVKGRFSEDMPYYQVDFPPKYQKGMGEKGLAGLMDFIDRGGRIVAWERSTKLFFGELKTKVGKNVGAADALKLPIRDMTKQARDGGLHVPGSLLRVELNTKHPLTLGMPEMTGVFSRGALVMQTRPPLLDTDRRVIAVYPEKDLLQSGYIKGEKLLANRPAMVWLKMGRGQLVLFGFNPLFRGSTPATYKLVWNSLLLP